jgi:regulator of replication initiation timing
MFFNKYKKKIESLEKDLAFWQKSCDELQKTIDDLKEENNILKNNNTTLNNRVIEIDKLSQENEIMRKYYKVDEVPSSDVQAKILADLRLHDMEFKMLQERLNSCKQQLLYSNQMQFLFPYYSAPLRYY